MESSTIDLGTEANFQNIIWQPLAQLAEVGTNPIVFQIASTNSSSPAVWDFVGPDGTASSYYTATNTIIWSGHSDHRYFRYRAYLSTADSQYSPLLSEVAFTYTNGCTPPGQSFFGGLFAGTYNFSVTRAGYLATSSTVDVSGNGEVEVNMSVDR